MATQQRYSFVAPLALALAFAGHLLNVLIFEPGLGFSGPEDFYDVDKLLPIVGHPVWKMGALYHVVAGIAVAVLASNPKSERSDALKSLFRMPGFGAAVVFVAIGMSNLVGLRELGNVAQFTDTDMWPVNAAFVVVRTFLLNVAVLLLGAFLLLGNAGRLVLASDRRWARYTGIAAGLFCVLMPLVPVVTPAVILSMIGWGMLAAILTYNR